MAISEQRKRELDAIVARKLAERAAANTATPQLIQAPAQGGEWLNKASQVAKDLGIGVAKGLGGTLAGASSLGEKMLSVGRAEDTLGGRIIGSGITTPQGTAQKVGQAVERVGEYVAMGALTGQPFALTPAGVAGRAGLAAGTATVLESAHQAGLNGEVAKSAATAGAISLVFSGLEAMMKALPANEWKQVLKRTPVESLKNPKLPEQAAATKLAAATRAGLLTKSKEAIQDIELTLDDVLESATGKVEGKAVAGYLDGLKTAYANIPGEQGSVKLIEGLQDDLISKGTMDAAAANEVKRNIYQLVEKSYGKGIFEVGVKTEAQKIAASAIRQEIEKIAPEVKDLNAQQAVYIGIKNAMQKALARSEGKGLAGTGIGLYDILLGMGGGAAGAAGGPVGMGLGSAAAVAGKKFIESPLLLTAVSNVATRLNSLSPTMKVIIYNGITGLVNEMMRKDKTTKK